MVFSPIFRGFFRRLGYVLWILAYVIVNINSCCVSDSDGQVNSVLTPALNYGLEIMPKYRCCVPICGSETEILHKFPNPNTEHDRFWLWITRIGGNLLVQNEMFIYKNCRVCHMHFEVQYHTRAKYLSANAVPTLHLRETSAKRPPLKEVTNLNVSTKNITEDVFPTTPLTSETSAKQPLTKATNLNVSTRNITEDVLPTPSTSETSAKQPLTKATNLNVSTRNITEDVSPTPSTSGTSIKRPLLKQVTNLNVSPRNITENVLPTTPSTSGIQQKHTDEIKTDAIEIKIGPVPEESKLPKGSAGKTMSNQSSLGKTILKLRKLNESFQKRLKKATKLSTNTAFQNALKKFKTLAAIFTVMQFREIGKAKQARQYTKDEKIMALTIYKLGPKVYRWLAKIFILPSPSTLSRVLKKASLRPGINENIFNQLEIKVQTMRKDHKLCILLFDEMSITPHFDYNSRKDMITGFVNHRGQAERKIADHVLVFIIRGIVKNYKQAIYTRLYYSFCRGSTPNTVLATQIKEIIAKLQSIGLTVLATVCDQGTSNTSAINRLIEENRVNHLRREDGLNQNVFKVNGQVIIPLYDVPHLIKGLRNNLLTKNLRFTLDEKQKVAKWEHIERLYENNPTYKGIRLCKNLTENHCCKDKIPKMKVKYATQLFSQTFGATMGYLADEGILPKETEDTADLMIFLDNLFDSFNGSKNNSQNRSGKDLLLSITPYSRHAQVWSDAKTVLKSMKFISQSGASGTVPSIKNWLRTIENMEVLRDRLFNDFNIKSIWGRHFNQDPLENFFGSIRCHGARNNSPTCTGFESAFATLLINNMRGHYSPGSNCEDDAGIVIESFHELFFGNQAEHSEKRMEIDFDDLSEDIVMDINQKMRNPIIKGQLEYVTGHLLKKINKITKSCKVCKKDLYENDSTKCAYLKYREYNKKKKCLMYPSQNLIKLFSEVQDIMHYILKHKCYHDNLKTYVKTVFYVVLNANFKCQGHKNILSEYIYNYLIIFFSNIWCKNINKILKGTITKFDPEDAMQRDASVYYAKRKKNKK